MPKTKKHPTTWGREETLACVIDVETVACTEAAGYFLADEPELDVRKVLDKMQRPDLDALAVETGRVVPKEHKTMGLLRAAILEQLPHCESMPGKLQAAHHALVNGWRSAYYKDAALQPISAQVAAVGVRMLANHEVTDVEDVAGVDEATLLKRAAFWIAQADVVVGYNLNGFDGPMLRNRMLVREVPVPAIITAFPRYRDWPQVDLYAELTSWNPRVRGKLRDWCWRFGLDLPPDTDPNEIQAWFDAEEWDKLESHVGRDTVAAAELYCRLWPLLGARL